MNKYIKTKKFLRKPVTSTPLNAIDFSDRQKKALDGSIRVMPR